MWCRGHHRTSVGTPVLITAKALPAWLCYVEGHRGDKHLPEADLRGRVYRAYERSVSINRIVHLPTGSQLDGDRVRGSELSEGTCRFHTI